MGERTTLNVTKEAHQRAKEAKGENETWSEYITRCIDEGPEPNPGVDTSEIVEQMRDQLSMASDPGVDEEQIVEEINKRLDDLEARMPRKVAEELK